LIKLIEKGRSLNLSINLTNPDDEVNEIVNVIQNLTKRGGGFAIEGATATVNAQQRDGFRELVRAKLV
jgi:hypothetical protein